MATVSESETLTEESGSERILGIIEIRDRKKALSLFIS